MSVVNSVAIDSNICGICRDPTESADDSKTLDCCLKIIHNSCYQQMVDTGNLTCCFCKTPISQISTQERVQSAMQRAFQKRKYEEAEDIAMLVQSMYNPDDLDLSIDNQMDNFLLMLANMEEPLVYKRRLWAEFTKQMKNPASQVREHCTKEDVENEFAMSFVQRLDQVQDLISEEPFVISRDMLQATAQALHIATGLTNEEKKEEWDTFFEKYRQDFENRDVINLFVMEKKAEFSFLQQETALSDSSSSSQPFKKQKI